MQASRFFNNSGPVNEIDHLCVSPIKRLDTNKVWQLILQKKYFLICGPKQCGKTSYLLALAKTINRNNYAKCLYFNVESLRGVQEDLEESIRSVLFEISSRARDTFGDEYLEDLVPGILERRGPYQSLNELLTQWCKRSDKPVVLLMDEIDTLQDKVRTSILSQIRAGYDKRPALFPQSIIFCATHDVIDKQFNIKDATLRVGSLRREDLDSMFFFPNEKQEIEIDKETIDRIWRYSAGQPWIISTLAGELLHEIAPAKGLNRIGPDQIDEAIDNIIAKKGNHLDYLVSQLRDERVKRCLIPLLASEPMSEDISEQDLTYIQELGLVKIERNMEISNDLYKEVVPRALIAPVAYLINLDAENFLQKDGSIDVLKLLRSFQAFYRNHGSRLNSLIDYGAAGYVLIFQALLQKLADANNCIHREYGISQGRVILKLQRNYPQRQVATFLLKPVFVWSYEKSKPLVPQTLKEAAAYAASAGKTDDAGCGEMHAIVINVNPEFDWEGKMPYMKRDIGGHSIHFWGF